MSTNSAADEARFGAALNHGIESRPKHFRILEAASAFLREDGVIRNLIFFGILKA
ncbi:hypothetical protein HMPREF0322_01016 [Desulfitobacterium hafniense DP7]|uniref:Uncharacterized protein n=1 Tax=Desulfitobacterium hafniense DP7 TaxID=537010 RepID=G9XJ90_DESHA|nr:hypothetical protein HMPREF0322_01016 [Desulfitobacterium hafniense DP7]